MSISKLQILNNDNYRLLLAIIIASLVLIAIFWQAKPGQSLLTMFENKHNSLYQKSVAESLGEPVEEVKSVSVDTPEMLSQKNTSIKIYMRKNTTTTLKDAPDPEPDAEPETIVDTLTETPRDASITEIGGEQEMQLEENLLFSIPPAYPYAARESLFEGIVILQLSISPLGIVKDIKILQSSGYEILDQEAKQATSKWIFKKNTGSSHNREITIEIEFVLDGTADLENLKTDVL